MQSCVAGTPFPKHVSIWRTISRAGTRLLSGLKKLLLGEGGGQISPMAVTNNARWLWFLLIDIKIVRAVAETPFFTLVWGHPWLLKTEQVCLRTDAHGTRWRQHWSDVIMADREEGKVITKPMKNDFQSRSPSVKSFKKLLLGDGGGQI